MAHLGWNFAPPAQTGQHVAGRRASSAARLHQHQQHLLAPAPAPLAASTCVAELAAAPSHPCHHKRRHKKHHPLHPHQGSRRPQVVCAAAAPPAPPAAATSSTNGTAAAQGGGEPRPQPEMSVEEVIEQNSAKAKMELLQALQKRSQAALRDSDQTSPPRMIDSRMYAAAVQAQRRISEKLSDCNLYINVLEDRVASYDDDLEHAQNVFKKVSMEFGTTGRLADAAIAAVKFGVDRQDAIAKVVKLRDRLTALEKAIKREREAFAKCVPRKVPVTWVGVAREVRLVGDFDQWTRGVQLTPPDVQTDGTMRTFEATLNLLPGKYSCKFMVDGEWRLAPEWPMEKTAKGTNNVLEVK